MPNWIILKVQLELMIWWDVFVRSTAILSVKPIGLSLRVMLASI
ncbi:hypothetical protein [Nitrospira sp. M1]